MPTARNLCRMIVTLALLSSAGCREASQVIDLRYGVQGPFAQGSGAVEIAKVAEPNAQRDSQGRIAIAMGTERQLLTTLNRTVIEHVADKSVAQWVSDAFQVEFAAARYAPVQVNSLSPACDQGVEIEITHVSVGRRGGFPLIGSVARVELKLTMVRKGRKIGTFDLVGVGEVWGIAAQENEYSQALEKALAACTRQAIRCAPVNWK